MLVIKKLRDPKLVDTGGGAALTFLLLSSDANIINNDYKYHQPTSSGCHTKNSYEPLIKGAR